MGYVELQYQLTQEGMTVEQVDYLESNASLLTALDLALYNIAAAGIKIAGSGVLSEKFKELLKSKKTSWYHPNGSINYPPNNGAVPGTEKMITLQPGTKIDRYGAETGRYVSPYGTPFANRSLPPGSDELPYHVYEVLKPIQVQSGLIAAWFDQPGGGIQYQFAQTIENLIQSGYLRRLP